MKLDCSFCKYYLPDWNAYSVGPFEKHCHDFNFRGIANSYSRKAHNAFLKWLDENNWEIPDSNFPREFYENAEAQQ